MDRQAVRASLFQPPAVAREARPGRLPPALRLAAGVLRGAEQHLARLVVEALAAQLLQHLYASLHPPPFGVLVEPAPVVLQFVAVHALVLRPALPLPCRDFCSLVFFTGLDSLLPPPPVFHPFYAPCLFF